MSTAVRNGASKSILISDGIRASARRTPHKVAITEGLRTLTYQQLIHRIDRVSNLAHFGLKLRHGDRVALFMKNRLEFIFNFLKYHITNLINYIKDKLTKKFYFN